MNKLLNKVAVVTQLYLLPLVGCWLLVSGIFIKPSTLSAGAGGIIAGFYLGLRCAFFYVRHSGMVKVDPEAVKRHHDWINHGGDNPFKR